MDLRTPDEADGPEFVQSRASDKKKSSGMWLFEAREYSLVPGDSLFFSSVKADGARLASLR